MLHKRQKFDGVPMGLFRGLPARFPLKMIHWIIFRALQARKSRETADGACSYLTASGFFIGPRRLFAVLHRLNWRKLPESVIKQVRPLGFQRDEIPLARVWAAEAQQNPSYSISARTWRTRSLMKSAHTVLSR